ncbi:hypothetical protein HaLaN_23307 [Haematococcus lacustris]|uniref:Uncharacterized protein n=1 Tax=Haematococcus lacustris TaxID=44745 RepID=A0A699ZSQ2_HAELA|nr:hypothetical protein HaLaN_23307 [Haematococcus lacustris]
MDRDQGRLCSIGINLAWRCVRAGSSMFIIIDDDDGWLILRRSQLPGNPPPCDMKPVSPRPLSQRRSKNYLALSGAQCLPKDRHFNSCDFAPCEARRISTLRHTVVSGTCNAQQQSEPLLLRGRSCGKTWVHTWLSSLGTLQLGHQLQQTWQLHVPATTMLQQLQEGLHWGIGDGAGKDGRRGYWEMGGVDEVGRWWVKLCWWWPRGGVVSQAHSAPRAPVAISMCTL